MGIERINKPDGVGAIGTDVKSEGPRRNRIGVDPVNLGMSSLSGSDLGNSQGGDAVTLSEEALEALNASEGGHHDE